MKTTYAAFLTEKEALEYITREFGEDATVKACTIDNHDQWDIDEIPFSWSGETSAYMVNGGEAFVAYWEVLGAKFVVEFCGVKVETDALYRAREIAERMKKLAEDCNAAGVITIDGEEETEVELFDEDEPQADAATFANVWTRREIGRTIKAAREAKGYTIRELAAMVDMSKNHISRIEGGIYNYTLDNLNTIARALGIELKLD